MTHSSFAVGMLGAAQFVPLMVCAFVGGVVADRFDRRTVLVITSVLLCLLSALLVVNASFAHSALWPVYLLPALAAGVSGIDLPRPDESHPRTKSSGALRCTAPPWACCRSRGSIAFPR